MAEQEVREFPYKAWALQPSFKPVEVEIVERTWGGWVKASNGKQHLPSALSTTKAGAIAFGRSRLREQETDLQKKLANIEKRRAALDKAEAA